MRLRVALALAIAVILTGPRGSLASGRKVDASLDDDAVDLKAYLQRAYGRAEISLAKGWTSSPALELTHVGRPLKVAVSGGGRPTDRRRRHPG